MTKRIDIARAWMRALVAAVVLLACAIPATSAVAAVAPSADPGPSSTPVAPVITNGPVYATLRTADRTYIGGAFTHIGTPSGHLVAYDSSAVPATSRLNTLPDVAGGDVNAIVPDGFGGWWIGGSFSHVGGFPRHGLAHVDAGGSVVNTWVADLDANVGSEVRALVFRNGNLYVGGSFTTVAGVNTPNFAVVDGSGIVQPVTTTVNGPVNALALNPSGTELFVGGAFTTVSGTVVGTLTSFDLQPATPYPGAPVLSAFRPNQTGTIRALAVNPGLMGTADEGLYVGGDFTGALKAWNASNGASVRGQIPVNLNPTGTTTTVAAIAVAGTEVYAAGAFTGAGTASTPTHAVARLLPNVGNGSLDVDPSFVSSLPSSNNLYVRSLAVTANHVFAGGTIGVDSIHGDNLVALDRTSGAHAPGWQPGPGGEVRTLALAGSQLLVGGSFAAVDAERHRGLAALNPDGTLDPGFSAEVVDGVVQAMTISPATPSRLVIGGSFTSLRDVDTTSLARTYVAGVTVPSGQVDAGYSVTWTGILAGGKAMALAAHPSNGTIWVGGELCTVNPCASATNASKVARIPAAGGAATNMFGVKGSTARAYADHMVYALAFNADASKVYVGGDFALVNTSSFPNLASFPTAGGSPAMVTGSSPSGAVRALAVHGGSDTLYAGGEFSTPQPRLMAVTSTGTLVAGWNPSPNNTVRALAINDGGADLFVGGEFSMVGASTYNGLAQVDRASGVVRTWYPNLAPDAKVFAIDAADDGVQAGGLFSPVAVASSPNVAHFPRNQRPDVPSGLAQRNAADEAVAFGGWTNSTQPKLSFGLDDPDSAGPVQYAVQLFTSVNHASPLLEYQAPSGPEGTATYVVGQGGGSYSVGTAGMSLGEGLYDWRVLSFDAAGASSATYSSFVGQPPHMIGVDLTAPTGSLTAPSAGATIAGTTTVSAVAADPGTTASGVASVKLNVTISGVTTTLCTDTSAPYSCSWTSTDAGPAILAGSVTDNAGNQVTLAGVTVQVDNAAPTGTISASPIGPITGVATISGTSTDAHSGVQKVDVRYAGPASGNICLAPASPTAWTCAWSTGSLPDGTYTITLEVTDVAGNREATAIMRTLVLDNQVPTVTPVSFTEVSGGQYQQASGTTMYFNPAMSGSFTVNVNATDGASMNRVDFPDLDGAGSLWTPAGSSDTTGPAPYTGTYSWSPGATSPGAKVASAVDNAGNTATAAFSVVADTSAPTGGSVTYADGMTSSSSVTVTFATGSDVASSGIGSWKLMRRSASLDGTLCGAFSAWAQVGAANLTPPYVDSTIADSTCYEYQLVVADAVSNTSTYVSASQVHVDRSSPTLTFHSFVTGAGTYASGTTLYYRPGVSTATSFGVRFTAIDNAGGSGVQRVSFPQIGTTGWPAPNPSPQQATTPDATTTDRYSATYTYNPGAVQPGSALNATTQDFAANAGAASSFLVRSDATAPSGGTLAYATGSKTDASPVSLTFTPGTDGSGSGVATPYVVQQAYAPFAATAGACGTFGAMATIGTTAAASYDVTLGADGCYRWQLVVKDNVGNQYTIPQVGTLKFDPTAASATFPTPADGTVRQTVTLTGAAADTGSGIASATLQTSVDGIAWTGTLGTPAIATGTWTHSWSTTASPNGTTYVRLRLTNGLGTVSYSPVRVYMVDNASPNAAVTAVSFTAGAAMYFAPTPTPRLWYSPLGLPTSPGEPFATTVTATDGGGSTLASVVFPDLSATLGAGATMTAANDGPDGFRHTYLLAQGVTAPTSIAVAATDGAGNATSVSLALEGDPDRPLALLGTVPAFVRGSLSVAGSNGDGTGSGLASMGVDLAGATLPATPVCAAQVAAGGWSGCSIDTTAYADGDYTLTASATDRVGNVSDAAAAGATRTTRFDNAAPTIGFLSMTATNTSVTYQPVVGGNVLYYNPLAATPFDVNVSMSATDGASGSGVTGVAFEGLGTGWPSCAATAPSPGTYACRYTFNPASNPAAVTATRKAVATDAVGLTAPATGVTSADFNVLADTAGPTVAFTTPSVGAVQSGVTSVAIGGTADDLQSGLASWELLQRVPGGVPGTDDVTVATGTATTVSYSWDTSSPSIADGSWTYTLRATDNVGRVSSTTLVVQLNNNPTPAEPVLLAPVPRVAGSLPRLTLVWQRVIDQPVLGYDVRVYTAGGTPGPTMRVTDGTTTEVTLLGEVELGAAGSVDNLHLQPGATYTYEVRSVGASAGEPTSAWTAPVDVTIPKVPMAIGLTHATAGLEQRLCGDSAGPCAYDPGTTIRMRGFVSSRVYAPAGGQVRLLLERYTGTRYDLIDELSATISDGGQFVLNLDRDFSGRYRVHAVLLGNAYREQADEHSYFTVG